MAVFIPIPIEGIEESISVQNKTYKLDLQAGRIIGTVDGMDGVRQAITKIILTERYAVPIYDDEYGLELRALTHGDDATRELITSALPGLLEDSLLDDERILEVQNITLEFQDESLIILCTVNTTEGEITEGVKTYV
ncbi:MAG: DUF2634 domain-containing protein [Oscillospiraceae bacterium]|jgi:hypothetical protein|nr:DUF2634 domain-containing protein [Oscillospiraceae bacterium]